MAPRLVFLLLAARDCWVIGYWVVISLGPRLLAGDPVDELAGHVELPEVPRILLQ